MSTVSPPESPAPTRSGATGESRSGVRRAADALWTLYAVLGGLAVLALLGVVLVDVALRYIASSGVKGANDMVASWFMTAIAFTGIALAQKYDGRIQVDFLMDTVPGRLRQVVDVVVVLAVAVVGALFAWYGWQEALEQMEAGEYAPIGHLPIWPFRFLVPLGFAGFTVACVLTAVDLVRGGPTEVSAADLEHERAHREHTPDPQTDLRSV